MKRGTVNEVLATPFEQGLLFSNKLEVYILKKKAAADKRLQTPPLHKIYMPWHYTQQHPVTFLTTSIV